MIFDDILIFMGGLALFLYGMHLMGRGLSGALGSGLERALKRFSLSGWRAVAAGAGVTALLQSSSAVTVMVVELVETGVLGLEQAVGLIIGANIGTTATAWIVAAGSTVPAEPVLFFGILGIAGAVVLLCSGREKLKETAVVLIGMELLFFGIDRMGAAVEPLGGMPNVRGWLVRSLNPVAGVLAGAAFTAIIQSSSASVGMLQMLAETGRLTYGNVIPLLLGQNIGTCVTALLACLKVRRAGRYAAWIHMGFNVAGVIVFMAIFYGLNAVCRFDFLAQPASSVGIAMFHSLFNVSAAITLYSPMERAVGRMPRPVYS